MLRKSVLTLFMAAVAVLDGRLTIAQTAYPMLMSLKPVAVQAGQSAEVTVSTRYNLYGAYQVLISGEGVAAEVIAPEVKQPEVKADEPPKKPSVDKLKLKVTAEANAMPGIRDIRIATPQGVSTVAQLVITRDPVITEVSPNDKAEQAQAIELPAGICGAIE